MPSIETSSTRVSSTTGSAGADWFCGVAAISDSSRRRRGLPDAKWHPVPDQDSPTDRTGRTHPTGGVAALRRRPHRTAAWDARGASIEAAVGDDSPVPEPLLHLVTIEQWRATVAAGVLAPPSLGEVG